MYKYIFIITVTCCILLGSCASPEKENALEYKDFLIKSIDPVVEKMVDFEDAVYNDDCQKLETIRKELHVYAAGLKEKINRKQAYDGNEKFKAIALEMLNFYTAVTEKQYQTIVKLKEQDVGLRDETVEKIEDILSEIYHKENTLYQKFEAEARLFSEKYGFEQVVHKH